MGELLLNDELRSWIGREVFYIAPEPLSRASIRYFARAIGYDSPVYTDDEAARAAGYDGVIAPPTLVCETNQYMDQPRSPDGYIGHLWDLPISGCRLIRGGHAYTFGQPVRPDDVITARWRIAEMFEKTSRSGSPMLFVVSDVTYTNQHGHFLARNAETTIYQPVMPAETFS